uniref:Uncharacterized protein n=1 Tax=Panagrolaimus sp. ES5 TaxID=591445 RepID=A0AC34G5U9_9BILA
MNYFLHSILIFICFGFGLGTDVLGDPYSKRYAVMKSTIESLLENEPGTEFSKFASGLQQINLTNLQSADGRNTFAAFIKKVEESIIQNTSISDPLTKLKRLGTEMDLLFVKKPIIEDYVAWQNIGTWGPISVFQFILDEYNVDYFWSIVGTSGGYRCTIYDHLFKLTKGNKVIQRNLYTTNATCDKSIKMVVRIMNLPYDFPVYERNVVKTTILPNGISVNQIIRVAKLYFISKSITCGRLLHIFGNYRAAGLENAYARRMQTIFNILRQEYVDKTSDYCVTSLSKWVTYHVDEKPDFVQAFMKVKWEKVFGSIFENVIVHDCQIQLLKSHAPEFYAKKIVKQEL